LKQAVIQFVHMTRIKIDGALSIDPAACFCGKSHGLGLCNRSA